MRKILLLLATFTFFACDSATSVVGDFLITDADEVALGANYHQEIITSAEYPLAAATDPLHIYINEIGNKILNANLADAGFRQPDATTGFKYTFSVIDDTVVNAFATPGGYIYIYRGLVDKANNEAEVATVVAHEMGHVVQKHFKTQYVQQYGTQAIVEMIAGEGLLSNAVTFFAGNQYSQTDEFEADSCGVVFSAAAGYNAYGFIGFFNTLKALSGSGSTASILSWFSTHPDTDERIATVRDHLTRKYPTMSETDTTGYYTAEFLTRVGR